MFAKPVHVSELLQLLNKWPILQALICLIKKKRAVIYMYLYTLSRNSNKI